MENESEPKQPRRRPKAVAFRKDPTRNRLDEAIDATPKFNRPLARGIVDSLTTPKIGAFGLKFDRSHFCPVLQSERAR
jgi:hypothetical protein